MIYKLIIANKATGQIWDISPSVINVDLEYQRTGAPAKLTFQWLKAGDVSFFEGDIVRFEVDSQVQFYGWVFTKEKDRWNVFSVTCYDRLRYLKQDASYAFYGQTVGGILKQIAEDLQLDLGEIEDSSYQIPSLIESNQSCLDIIQDALNKTLLATGKLFVFYDNGSGLSLKAAEDWKSEYILGDKSYLTDYTYTTDIDSSTYNYIKLIYQDELSGRLEAVVAQDSNTIARWGRLPYIQEANGDYNRARLLEIAENILASSNRRKKSFSCSALGIPGLRAGQMIRFKIDALGDINLDQWLLLETVSHHFENDIHTMEIETRDL